MTTTTAHTRTSKVQVCSSIHPGLIHEIEEWAHMRRVSRSSAIESAVAEFLDVRRTEILEASERARRASAA